MPPVNTPRLAVPADTPTPTRPLTPLSHLSSPVPDLVATLHTASAAAAEADEANVRFLRDSTASLDELDRQGQRRRPTHRVDRLRDPRPNQPPQPVVMPRTPADPSARSSEETTRRDRLQRVLSRLNRLHDAPAASSAAYTNRSPARQSLYDWAPDTRAPATRLGEQDVLHRDDGLDEVFAALRRDRPGTPPELLQTLDRGQGDGERETAPRPRAEGMSAQRRRDELRSRAMLQRARTEGSPSATERMLRYVMERERSGLSEEEERARLIGLYDQSASPDTSPGRYARMSNAVIGSENSRGTALDRTSALLPEPSTSSPREQQRVDAFRRRYLSDNMPPPLQDRASTPSPAHHPSPPPSLLESALKYLEDLRSWETPADATRSALAHGLQDFLSDTHRADFLTNPSSIPPLSPCSFLQSGAVFEGHQQTGHAAAPTAHIEQINPNLPPLGLSSTHPPDTSTASRPWPKTPPQTSSWPVRVRFHALDPASQTLQGTMEAYDVPPHPSLPAARPSGKPAPITTFVEAQLIDFHTHSLLTPAQPYPPTTPAADAEHWRALPPFHSYPSDAALARALLSPNSLPALLQDFVFMRWKERCFVPRCSGDDNNNNNNNGDARAHHGLTIRGFYYVSLRRCDGRVEAVYVDQRSAPRQGLRMESWGRGAAGGGWAFR